MNILGILPGLLKVIGDVTGIKILGDASNALAATQLTPEQQAAVEKATRDYQAQMAQIGLDTFKTAMSEALAEIQSTDRYTSRARPTGLYIFYLCSGAIVGAMLLGLKIDPTAILTVIGPLAGVGGTYVYQRTREKIASVSNGGN